MTNTTESEKRESRGDGCLFCRWQHTDVKDVLLENDKAYAVYDGYPVTQGHVLVIPKRHVTSYFDLERNEIKESHRLLLGMRSKLDREDPTIDGFNVGVNDGEVAGQTILHCHIHLIPRRSGDVEKPRGGVRHVIPGKGDY